MSAAVSPEPPEFPARPVQPPHPSHSSRPVGTDVLIIGAGPTGLMAGAWCAKLGVQALVVDPKPGPTRESRALALQARSVEVYRQLGLAQEVLERSTPARSVNPGYRRRTLGSLPLDRVGHRLTAFPGITIFEQSANEELLAEYLASRRRTVAWGTAFQSLQATPEGPVTVALETATGPVSVRARYVVAADGASSPVRHALGIGFTGSTNRFEFYVLDAYGVTGTEPGITVRASGEHFMLAFPMGDDGRGGWRARLLGILRAEDRAGNEAGDESASGGPAGEEGPAPGTHPGAADAHDEARAQASLAEEFGVHYAGTDWYSTYRVHHRVATAFRAGRVFLAGDAAHIHSPVGAQGMNTGLQDAQNIIVKIADVLAGRTGEETLDRYEPERRPVALNLVRTTDVVFGAVTSMSGWARLFRLRIFPVVAPVALRLVPRSPAGGRLFGYLSQIRIHYWMPGTEGYETGSGAGGEGDDGAGSAPSTTWRRRFGALFAPRTHRGRVLGRRLPWVPDAGHEGPVPGGDGRGDNHEALNTPRWQVHAYGPAAVGVAEELAERHARLAVPGDPGGPASGVPVHAFRAAPQQGLPDGTAVLVRPDGFVAERVTAPEADAPVSSPGHRGAWADDRPADPHAIEEVSRPRA
jgi:2-polyprenyl-6-methoxyphenol hydroxylase-like FAD-dependent oxidoreductase